MISKSKDLGTLKYFRMEFLRSKSGIILDLLKETGLLGSKVAETTIEHALKLEDAIKKWYKEKRRVPETCAETCISFSYTSSHRFAVRTTSQFLHAPRPTHFDAIYRILWYLKGTSGKGILFKRHDHPNHLTKANWAGVTEDPLLVTTPLLEEILLLSKVKNRGWLQEVVQKHTLEL